MNLSTGCGVMKNLGLNSFADDLSSVDSKGLNCPGFAHLRRRKLALATIHS